MKKFLLLLPLVLAGCFESTEPGYTISDRARDIQTNNFVWVILIICALLFLKAAYDQFAKTDFGEDEDEDEVSKPRNERSAPPSVPAPGSSPAPDPTKSHPDEEIEDDRP